MALTRLCKTTFTNMCQYNECQYLKCNDTQLNDDQQSDIMTNNNKKCDIVKQSSA